MQKIALIALVLACSWLVAEASIDVKKASKADRVIKKRSATDVWDSLDGDVKAFLEDLYNNADAETKAFLEAVVSGMVNFVQFVEDCDSGKIDLTAEIDNVLDSLSEEERAEFDAAFDELDDDIQQGLLAVYHGDILLSELIEDEGFIPAVVEVLSVLGLLDEEVEALAVYLNIDMSALDAKKKKRVMKKSDVTKALDHVWDSMDDDVKEFLEDLYNNMDEEGKQFLKAVYLGMADLAQFVEDCDSGKIDLTAEIDNVLDSLSDEEREEFDAAFDELDDDIQQGLLAVYHGDILLSELIEDEGFLPAVAEVLSILGLVDEEVEALAAFLNIDMSALDAKKKKREEDCRGPAPTLPPTEE